VDTMARKDAAKPPIDKYRKEIGKHDKKKGDKINKAEKRQREAEAAWDSAFHKWPLLILGVISVSCGILYLALYFWLASPENQEFMEAMHEAVMGGDYSKILAGRMRKNGAHEAPMDHGPDQPVEPSWRLVYFKPLTSVDSAHVHEVVKKLQLPILS